MRWSGGLFREPNAARSTASARRRCFSATRWGHSPAAPLRPPLGCAGCSSSPRQCCWRTSHGYITGCPHTWTRKTDRWLIQTNLRFGRVRLGPAAQFAALDIEHVIAKSENHRCSPGSARARGSLGKDKLTLRVNQAHLKAFPSGLGHPPAIENAAPPRGDRGEGNDGYCSQ